MNFETLEEIQAHCQKAFPQSHLFRHEDNQIAQTQVPPTRTYIFRMTALPPETGLTQAQEFAKLKIQLDKLGFQTTVDAGKVQQGGYHLQLSVKDKRQQLYSLGQPVGFRLNPQGPPTRFRVKNCSWNTQRKEFDYHIESEDGQSGAKTVPESSLTKI